MRTRYFLPLTLVLAAYACNTLRSSQGSAGARAKDLGQHNGYTIFTWPKPEHLQSHQRDYDALAEQMTQYAQNVGHILHRSPEGISECSWVEGARRKKILAIQRVMDQGSDVFCKEVKKCHVDQVLPTGTGDDRSEFCQYGNCGEGGRVGACLAHDFGFNDQEIRVCYSENDHFFAMVKGPTRSDKWCILDRWPDIGHFKCGVDWDESSNGVTVDGARNSDNWFQRVTCTTLDQYLTNGGF